VEVIQINQEISLIIDQIVDVRIKSCVECPHFEEVFNNSFTCELSNKSLPYIYKFPIPNNCPLP